MQWPKTATQIKTIWYFRFFKVASLCLVGFVKTFIHRINFTNYICLRNTFLAFKLKTLDQNGFKRMKNSTFRVNINLLSAISATTFHTYWIFFPDVVQKHSKWSICDGFHASKSTQLHLSDLSTYFVCSCLLVLDALHSEHPGTPAVSPSSVVLKLTRGKYVKMRTMTPTIKCFCNHQE